MGIDKTAYLENYLAKVEASLQALNADDLNYKNHEDLRANLRAVYQEKIASLNKQLENLKPPVK